MTSCSLTSTTTAGDAIEAASMRVCSILVLALCRQVEQSSVKAVFLDFDGVLNYLFGRAPVPRWVRDSGLDWGDQWILPHLVYKLVPLLKVPGVDLVVSGSWRHHWSMEQLIRILNDAHDGVGDRVLGVTPRKLSLSRTAAIRAWLSETRVSRYVIIDDDAITDPALMQHWVQVDGTIGLTNKDVERAIALIK